MYITKPIEIKKKMSHSICCLMKDCPRARYDRLFLITNVCKIEVWQNQVWKQRRVISCKVQFSWIFRKSWNFDRDVTFTKVLAVTRKRNVAGFYLHLLYNMQSKQVNLLIIASLWFLSKFYYYQILPMFNHQEIKFLRSKNSNVYISQRIFLITVWHHTTLRPMIFLWFSWP